MNIYDLADEMYAEFDFQSDGNIERDGWSFDSSSPKELNCIVCVEFKEGGPSEQVSFTVVVENGVANACALLMSNGNLINEKNYILKDITADETKCTI